MSAAGKNILIGLQRKWRFRLGLELFLYAFGPALLGYFMGLNWIWILTIFLCVLTVLFFLRKPWQLTLDRLASRIDKNIETVEYSSGLLLLPEEKLSSLAKLQRQKITESLLKVDNRILPREGLKWAGMAATFFLVAGLLISLLGGFNTIGTNNNGSNLQESITFKPVDSLAMKTPPPQLVSQQLTINYPSYTRKRAVTTSNMNVKALEGSRLSWKISFDDGVDSVFLASNSNRAAMKLDDGKYVISSTLSEQGFYSFRFVDKNGGTFSSDLFALEITTDQPPSLEIQGLKQFVSFKFDEPKQLQLKALINDDYGITDAHVIATVSKGAGESVKFREEKLSFDTKVSTGKKSLELLKKIDLDQLKMEPGDELYFYVEARDTRQPKSNTSRSETFFAMIKDTITGQFSVEGTMGADLMPDYFRSQRQLIIDTEKLIAEKSNLTDHEFNSRSNELGFDQKSLRLKYGEFIGDEADSGIQGGQPTQAEEQTDDTDDDPLTEFTHDHDGDNEHNLVDHDHEEGASEEETEDPLDDYLHDHDDPEESTLFTQSLKSKLQQAMAEMWDAELHLRLYTPKKSLPYQYKALKLIQEIKNSARIYVHRIGFDPPPIKEEVRLTGTLDEVNTYQKKAAIGRPEVYPNMRQAVQRIEELLSVELLVTEADQQLFEKAGNELAIKAIAEPGKYLSTLQGLKWLTEDIVKTTQMLVEVQGGLLLALPKSNPNPTQNEAFVDDINKLLLKELETYEQ